MKVDDANPKLPTVLTEEQEKKATESLRRLLREFYESSPQARAMMDEAAERILAVRLGLVRD